LELHRKYSPVCATADGAAVYAELSQRAASRLPPGHLKLISLGCGSGQKDALLARHLPGRCAEYLPVDTSPDLVLTAVETVQSECEDLVCRPQVLDLLSGEDWSDALCLKPDDSDVRVILFYGMLPNFDPNIAGRQLAPMLRPRDWLLLSANLAGPGDYAAGTHAALPLYDNPETRAWLTMALEDLGLSPEDAEWTFRVAESGALGGLLGIEVAVKWNRALRVELGEEVIALSPGEPLPVFRSNRFSVGLVEQFAANHGLHIVDRAVSADGQEGVFLLTG
jgi:uncharacterized SAM-dependent methyltransferase